MNDEYRNLKKENEYLRALTEAQQDTIEIYKKRFSKIKRSLTNPLYGLGFAFLCIKRRMWRFFPNDSLKRYDKWIRTIELNEPLPEIKPQDISIACIIVTESKDIHSPAIQTTKSVSSQSYPASSVIISDMTSISEVIEDLNCDYVGFVRNGDILSKNALLYLSDSIHSSNFPDMIYTDEDDISLPSGKRSNPFFKPDFSPDTLDSFYYTSSFSIYKKDILYRYLKTYPTHHENISGFLYDISKHLSYENTDIIHIKKVLYHNLLQPLYKEAKNDNHSLFDLSDHTVSIIIPSKDNPAFLKKLLDSIYSHLNGFMPEIIIVDNGSKDAVKDEISTLSAEKNIIYIYEPMDFNFSAMCNMGAKRAGGQYLLFLNDDIEITNDNWLISLVYSASKNHVGAVGAKLLYPKGNIIQHDGIVSILNAPIHALHHGDDRKIHYHGRNKYNVNVSAVTGAVLMIEKNKFEKVGGFDENLPVGFNDIDLCWSLLEVGFYNVVKNDISFIHHESISRGFDGKSETKSSRLLKEQRYLYMKHPSMMNNDPFYSPYLTQTRTDYSLSVDDF